MYIFSASASINVNTPHERRQALAITIELLEIIHCAEEAYLEQLPINLHGSVFFDNIEFAINTITSAKSLLECAYD